MPHDVLPVERTWTFTPARAWRDGTHGLRVSAALEDVAGNSLQRVFDAEIHDDRAATATVPAVLTRRFAITRR